MRVLEAETGCGRIHFYGESLNSGADYFAQANCSPDSAKVVLFFDSRGISGAWGTSLLRNLIEYFQSTNYLAICRPLELTTWATLYNFLRLNRLLPDLLITNIGIVDFTPKKLSLCQDMLEQINFASANDKATLEKLGDWTLSNGLDETLFTVNYPKAYANLLKAYFGSIPLVAIKTPLVSPAIQIERARPPDFFSQLNRTNQFIDWLGCKSVDLGSFDRQLTYDAVHWTAAGNQFVFKEVIRHL